VLTALGGSGSLPMTDPEPDAARKRIFINDARTVQESNSRPFELNNAVIRSVCRSAMHRALHPSALIRQV